MSSVTVFVTSKGCLRGETSLLCQKKKQSKEHAKTNARANLHPHRRASSCARKWNMSERANTALARQSKQSPSACPRHGGRVLSCLLQSEEKRERSGRLNGNLRGDAHAKNLPPGVRARPNVHSSAKAVARHRSEHCRNTPNGWRGDALHGLVRPPRRKQLAHVNAAVDMAL
jgi:hypothetical protein